MDAERLTALRRHKDEFFRNDPHSPIADRATFGGLRYFAPNPQLDLRLEVLPAPGDGLTLATSDGRQRTYQRAGLIQFAVHGQPVALTLLASDGRPGFFLPFRDSTSGRETYGGGRYLDLEPAVGGVVSVDFNLAYNPYCAYDEHYSCPLPPAENWLAVPIEAGELLPAS